MYLEPILESKRAELHRIKREQPLHLLEQRIRECPPPRDFKGALYSPPPAGKAPTTRIIAEVKKASPSRGIIRQDFNPVELASTFEANGAVALSVLTDRTYFQGSHDYLASIRQAVTLPLLNKDFIIDPYQIYQGRAYGADAVLLIAAVLPDSLLLDYLSLADTLSLTVLVEVHTLEELERVLATTAGIIGINNRNLTTFQVSTETTLRLINHIPDDRVVVSESGIVSRQDIIALREHGVDAFLIGEALMKEPDAGKRLRELIH